MQTEVDASTTAGDNQRIMLHKWRRENPAAFQVLSNWFDRSAGPSYVCVGGAGVGCRVTVFRSNTVALGVLPLFCRCADSEFLLYWDLRKCFLG